MAVADLMVVIVAVIIHQINFIYLFANFLFETPICSVTLVLQQVNIDCSVWFTVALTVDRFIAICCQKLQIKYCTVRIATAVIIAVGAVSCAQNGPFYFAVHPQRCVPSHEYVRAPLWAAYRRFEHIMTPVLPFGLILIFNTLTVRHIVVVNKLRRKLRCKSEMEKDPEMEKRNKSVILLFALSANFILTWTPQVIYSMTLPKENYSYTDKYFSTPMYILQQCGVMLKMLSTCTNTCIYGLTQMKFREELKKGARYLLTCNGKHLK
ncbi:C-C chemokine receptor type 2-like [Narcine bancroftii]|uniref:C-C chemokine receptor type 2-like n=1 Tax=Narcine bancroftii TaxID=1343680 RepID=UPI003831BAF9